MKTLLQLLLLLLLLAGCSKQNETKQSLNLLISPYQDLATITIAKKAKLEEKYDLNLNITTVEWQNIITLIKSNENRFDIGFASYIEYLTKYNKINKNTEDPILFISPLYVYKGGAFITFKDIQSIEKDGNLIEKNVNVFLRKKIALQKNTLYEMLILDIADKVKKDIKDVNIVDMAMNDAFFAAKNKEVDIAAVGLTQYTEALKQGGHSLLMMDSIGFSDLTGIICKKSFYEKNKEQVDNFIKLWFDSVAYLYKDFDKNAKIPLAYLKKYAATKYDLESYKRALSYEYLPKSTEEAKKAFVNGKYDYKKLLKRVNKFLKYKGIIKNDINIKVYL